MSLHDELPFRAEYAKSGRAGCKTCKEPIAQGSLRLATMTRSPFFDGMQPNWNHYACFFKRQRPRDVSEIGHYATLKYEDQKRIKETMAEMVGVPVEAKGKGKGKGKGAATKRSADAAQIDGNFLDFTVAYSPSARAKCRLCEVR